jgi:hypothetical protein
MSSRSALLPWSLALLWLAGCSGPSGDPCSTYQCSAGTCRVDNGLPRCVCGPEDLGRTCGSQTGDGNDTRSTATAITPSSEEHAGTIEVLRDVDFYSFPVTPGRTYRFTCIPETLGVCRVELDHSGNWHGVAGQEGHATVASALARETTGANVWYVSVSSAFARISEPTPGRDGGTAGLTGTYRFRLEELGPDDHGDTPETATVLYPAGEAGLGLVESEADTDVFAFTAEAQKLYRFDCIGEALYVCNLSVLDAQGQVVPNVFAAGFKAPSAGTWYVKRSTEHGRPGYYSYFFAPLGVDDHGDTAATATPIPFPASINGQLEISNDQDYFSFTGTAGHLFRMTRRPRGTVWFQVWDPTGEPVELLVSGTDEAYGGLPMDGRYVVRVAGNRLGYGFDLDDLGKDDFGDTPQTAAPLGVGGVVGLIVPRGDVDYFNLPLEARRVYRLRCRGRVGWFAACGLGFEAGTSLLLTDDAGNDLFDRRLIIKSDVDQAVALRLEGVDGAAFGYQLEVTDLGLDDHADSPGAASLIGAGVDVSGTHEHLGDKDDFWATLEAGRSYSVSLQSLSLEPHPGLYVYAPGASQPFLVPTLPYVFTAESGRYTFEVKSNARQRLGYVLRVEPG